MINPDEEWAEILLLDPTLTSKDKALFYTGISAGIAIISHIMNPHITDEMREKVWPQLEPVIQSIKVIDQDRTDRQTGERIKELLKK